MVTTLFQEAAGIFETAETGLEQIEDAVLRDNHDPRSVFLFDEELKICQKYSDIIGGPVWVLSKR